MILATATRAYFNIFRCLVTEFEPLTSSILITALTNWAMKPFKRKREESTCSGARLGGHATRGEYSLMTHALLFCPLFSLSPKLHSTPSQFLEFGEMRYFKSLPLPLLWTHRHTSDSLLKFQNLLPVLIWPLLTHLIPNFRPSWCAAAGVVCCMWCEGTQMNSKSHAKLSVPSAMR